MKTLIPLIFFFAVPVSADCPPPAVEALRHSTQLLVVSTSHWNSVSGTAQLWERSSTRGNWQPAGLASSAVVGRNGMAWGWKYSHLAGASQKPKREGDGRTPAGVYPLGRRFGFAAEAAPDYLHVTENSFCVDDPASRFYNTIVDASRVSKDWNSAEDMSRIEEYKLGMEVAYESSARERTGSCIFLHIWASPGKGTAGCIAFSENIMAGLHRALKSDRRPTIALLPEPELRKWKSCLPSSAKP